MNSDHSPIESGLSRLSESHVVYNELYPMSKDKSTLPGRQQKKTEISLVRSSAAEYLTFVAASGEGGVEAFYADENVWLSQKMMGQLYDVDVRTINYHLKRIFADNELQEDSVIRNFRITPKGPTLP